MSVRLRNKLSTRYFDPQSLIVFEQGKIHVVSNENKVFLMTRISNLY